MDTTHGKTEAVFSARRKKILKSIRGEAALFPAAQEQLLSRDLVHPFRQNSDLFYLTGFDEPDSALLLLGTTDGPRSVLYVRDRDPLKEQWQGERLGVKRARRRFDIDEVRDISELRGDLPQLLSGLSTLHYAPGNLPSLDSYIFKLFSNTIGPRPEFPHTLKDSRVMTSEMRLIKDRYEIQTLKHAIDITAHSFLRIAPRLKEFSSEAHAGRALESYFAQLGAPALGFETIIASGKNAVCLHHRPRLQPLFRHELVLIDAGALYNGYSADISRTLPVSGGFTRPQADIYDAVYRGLRAGIKKARPGSTILGIHETIVAELTTAMVELKLLKGSVSSLIESEKYKRFYPHRSGHFLGIDTHDITPLYLPKQNHVAPSYQRPLEPGCVFTIEPGLYIDSKDESVAKSFRGIGVRLEEDVLITADGCEILSSSMPCERSAVEELLQTDNVKPLFPKNPGSLRK